MSSLFGRFQRHFLGAQPANRNNDESSEAGPLVRAHSVHTEDFEASTSDERELCQQMQALNLGSHVEDPGRPPKLYSAFAAQVGLASVLGMLPPVYALWAYNYTAEKYHVMQYQCTGNENMKLLTEGIRISGEGFRTEVVEAICQCIESSPMFRNNQLRLQTFHQRVDPLLTERDEIQRQELLRKRVRDDDVRPSRPKSFAECQQELQAAGMSFRDDGRVHNLESFQKAKQHVSENRVTAAAKERKVSSSVRKRDRDTEEVGAASGVVQNQVANTESPREGVVENVVKPRRMGLRSGLRSGSGNGK